MKRKYNKSIYYDMRLREQKIFFTKPDNDKDVDHLKYIFYVNLLRDYQINYEVDLFRYLDDRDGMMLRKSVKVSKFEIEKFNKDYPGLRGVMKSGK